MRHEGNAVVLLLAPVMPQGVGEPPSEPHEARVEQVAMQGIHGMLRQGVALRVGVASGVLLLVSLVVLPTGLKDAVIVVANNRR
jgi:hypothetical protein